MNYLYLYKVIKFTLLQSFLTTIISLCIALILLPTVRKLDGYYWGKFVKSLINIPYYIPSLIGCLCIVILLGRNSIISSVLGAFNVRSPIHIYNITGIIVTQLFYYIPLLVRNLDSCLETIPGSYKKMSQSFDIPKVYYFRRVTFYFLKNEILASSFLVLLYTLHCFSIALIFGGNPNSTTLEVHIYKVLNFDFDYKSAIKISLLLFIICLPIHYIYHHFRDADLKFIGSKSFKNNYKKLSFHDYILISFCLLFFCSSLLIIIFYGFKNIFILRIFKEKEFIQSLVSTFTLGFFSSILCLVLVFLIMNITYKFRTKRPFISYLGNLIANLPMIVSPVVFGTIFLILFNNSFDNIISTYLLLIVFYTITSVPVIYRMLYSSFAAYRSTYDTLCNSLGMGTYKRYRYVLFPLLRKDIGVAISTIFIFSIGDLKAILLLNNGKVSTLPLLMYDKMNKYEFNDAVSIAALTIILIYLIFRFFQRIFIRIHN